MNLTYFSIFLLCTVTLVHLTPIFFRGRPWGKHGMLGSPKVHRSTNLRLAPDQWMNQALDHFDPQNTRTWKQRYFVNDSSYVPGGPVFLQLGGEGTADPVWLSVGQIASNYAPKFNALQLMIEHRYYGASHPTEDMSTANLKYLTSEQALADAASFIEYYKTIDPTTATSKFVVFGGSYPGSLSAWMRLKYPHLVAGAIASSAPVEAVIDFKDYLAVVRDSLGSQCGSAIQQATGQIERLLEHPMGWRLLTKTFNLCDPLDGTNRDDVANLVSTLAGNFEGVVQYNRDNRAFEGAAGANITIDVLCKVMEDETLGTPLERYAQVNDIIITAYNQNCVDYKYSNFIKTLQQVNWNTSASEGGRQWTYQTCVEFGFFQSSDLQNQPFGDYFPVEFFEKQCTDIFGSEFNLDLLRKGVEFTNTVYGGFGLKVKKVAFPNGSIDPWHALGITKYSDSDSEAIFINGTAHCADMYPDNDEDIQSLREGRAKIVQFLSSILESNSFE